MSTFSLQIVGGLVLGCIKTNFCKKICVWQHFSISTNVAHFCRCANSFRFSWKLSPNIVENVEIAEMLKYANLVELDKCCQTHIFLQNFVVIQPRTSPPRICRICNFFFKNCKNCQFWIPGHAHPLRRRAPRRVGALERDLRPAAGHELAPADPWGSCQILANVRQNFARFRPYRRRSLQVNTRFAASLKIYQNISLKFLKFGKRL